MKQFIRFNFWEGMIKNYRCYEYSKHKFFFLLANFVAARHCQQPGALHHAVPGLNAVRGAYWNCALARLDLCPQLTTRAPIHVPVSLLFVQPDHRKSVF